MVDKKKDDRTRIELPDRKAYPDSSELDRWMAEASAGPTGRNRTGLSKRIKERFEIPFAFLSEAQWKDISNATGFRRYVRPEINIALQKYWAERLSDEEAVVLGEKISNVKRDLDDAICGVSEVIHNKAMFQGMAAPHERSFAEQRLDLEMSLEWMARADTIMSDTADRLKRPQGAQRVYGQLYNLIHRLDFILLQHAGRTISQSKKPIKDGGVTPLEFVWMVAQAADRHVSKSHVHSEAARYHADKKRSEKKQQEWEEHLPGLEAPDADDSD